MYTVILLIAQLASATTRQQMVASSMPIKGTLTPPWSVVVLARSPANGGVVASLSFCLSGQYDSNHLNHGGCCPIAAEILVHNQRMRALIKILDQYDQFERSAARLTAIMI